MPSKPAGCARTARRDEAGDDLLDLGLGHRVAAIGVVVRGQPDGDQFGAKELSASPCWPT